MGVLGCAALYGESLRRRCARTCEWCWLVEQMIQSEVELVMHLEEREIVRINTKRVFHLLRHLWCRHHPHAAHDASTCTTRHFWGGAFGGAEAIDSPLLGAWGGRRTLSIAMKLKATNHVCTIAHT